MLIFQKTYIFILTFATLAGYFPDDFTPKQKVELIEKLVKEWYEKQTSVKESFIRKSIRITNKVVL